MSASRFPAKAWDTLRSLGRFDVREQAAAVVDLLRQIALGLLAGVVCGLASALFLWSLEHVTDWRIDHPILIAGLPAAGLVIGLAYHHLAGRASKGNDLLIEEIHTPTTWVPRRMAPLILVGTLVTHLFGGSAGREGTAIQMGGSLTDAAARLLRVGVERRRTLLIAAIAGGFGSVFGVPLAGCVFALEVQSVGRMRYEGLVAALTASVSGDLVVRALGIHHEVVNQLIGVHLDAGIIGKVAVAGVAFGLASVLFVELVHGVQHVFAAAVRWPPLRPVVGGVLVLVLTALVGTKDYLGLSTPLATRALAGGAGVVGAAFALKIVFTSVTLGSGFVGGEVTPLFVSGAAMGVVAGRVLHAPVPLMAAIGFVAVFGAAANTPLACTVMGVELFGSSAAALFAVGCVVAYVCSSHRSLYGSQPVEAAKFAGWHAPTTGARMRDFTDARRAWLPERRSRQERDELGR